MNHWRAVLPVPIHEFDYEETVADLEGVAAKAASRLRPGLGAGLPRFPPHADPFARPALPKFANLSTRAPWAVGETTRPSLRTCLRRYPRGGIRPVSALHGRPTRRCQQREATGGNVGRESTPRIDLP